MSTLNLLGTKLLRTTALSCLLCLGAPAEADQNIDFGDYVIHYNALNSSSITPAVAKTYKITRGQNHGVVVISVLRKNAAAPQGVTSMLQGQVRNDIAQISGLDFREIVEGNAVYYVGGFRHDNNERLSFLVNIQPEGQPSSYKLKFDQTFFIN